MRKGSLTSFLSGLAMLVVGGYWFLPNIYVSTGNFGIAFGSFRVNGGIVVVPFLVGIVWLFLKPKSIGAKFVTGLGLLVIIASIISTTHFVIRSMNLFTYLIILLLIFGGAALTVRSLFGTKIEDDD